MNKKTIILIALTALVSGLLYALPTFASSPLQGEQPPAAAAPEKGAHPKGKAPHGGEIIALGSDTLTVQPFAEGSDPITLRVDENTRFRAAGDEAEAPTFDDLQIGGKVGFIAPPAEDGDPIAKVIILLPDDFDPETFQRHTARGEVWSIDTTNGTFTLQAKGSNEQAVFYVDENTRFRSRGDTVQSLDDLAVHTQVIIRFRRQDDGTLLATNVVIPRPRLSRHRGTVASVDNGTLTLTLDRRDGQTLTFQVNEETRFKGEAASLDEVQPDMQALVAAFEDGSGHWTAVLIGTRTAPAEAGQP